MNADNRTMRPRALWQHSDDPNFQGSVPIDCRRIGLRALPRRTAVAFAPLALPVPKTFAPGSLMAWQADRVLAHIETYIEMPLRAAELAALVRLSSSYFFRAFKVSFGQSPHAYVLCRRVERAKRLILSAEPPSLAEIALNCGLSDQAHLSRVFLKLVGESPSAWRKKYRAPPSFHHQPAATRMRLEQD